MAQLDAQRLCRCGTTRLFRRRLFLRGACAYRPRMFDTVEAILREAAERAILPRFRRLAESDVIEKSPGELVTAADREAEALIGEALCAAFPGTRLVGEEGCAADPALLETLGEGRVWLLDPVDGTANFAAGTPPFSVMLALLDRGEAVASWMLDPLSGDLCVAERGGGALFRGERIAVDPSIPDLSEMRGAITSKFMPSDVRARIESALGAVEPLSKLMCSGAEYPAIALGRRHASLFWRTLPWDHVPGALFLEEAGGHVSRLDGSPYRGEREGEGLLIATNPAIASQLLEAIA
jgi:fructose-1,6-bisphosphatase/inositol monophosphatase family enzyme